MDKRTQASEIIESFESTFADKQVIPFSLELMWLKKAIGRYSGDYAGSHSYDLPR